MNSQVRDTAFWERFAEEMNAFHAELGARFDEVGRRKRELSAQLEREVRDREAPQPVGITWHSVLFGLPTATSAGGAVRSEAVARRDVRPARRRRRRWLWS